MYKLLRILYYPYVRVYWQHIICVYDVYGYTLYRKHYFKYKRICVRDVKREKPSGYNNIHIFDCVCVCVFVDVQYMCCFVFKYSIL